MTMAYKNNFSFAFTYYRRVLIHSCALLMYLNSFNRRIRNNGMNQKMRRNGEFSDAFFIINNDE